MSNYQLLQDDCLELLERYIPISWHEEDYEGGKLMSPIKNNKTKTKTLKLDDKEFIAELRRITNEQNNVISDEEIKQYVDEVVDKADKLLREMMLEAAQQGRGRLRLAPQFFVNLVDRKYIDYCLDISKVTQYIIADRFTNAGFDVFRTSQHEVEEFVWDDSNERYR